MANNYIKKLISYDTLEQGELIMVDPGAPAVEPYCIQLEVGFGYPKQILIGDTVGGVLVTAENLMSIVAEPSYYETVEVCFDGSPARAPTYAETTSITIQENFNIGWNSGGESIENFQYYNLYECEPTVDSVGVATGVTSSVFVEGYNFSRIEFGWMFERGTYRIIESNVFKTAKAGFATGDKFRIAVYPGIIIYYKNNDPVYTTLANPYQPPMQVDISMYSGGDRLNNADIVPAYLYPVTKSSIRTKSLTTGGTFTSNITSVMKTSSETAASDDAFVVSAMKTTQTSSSSVGRLLPTTVNSMTTTSESAFGILYAKADPVFEPLQSLASDAVGYSSSINSFQPLGTEVDVIFYEPSDPIVVQTAFPPLQIHARGVTGRVTTSSDMNFEPLVTMSSDKPYGSSEASFQPMTTFSYEEREYNGVISYLPTSMELSASGYPSETNRFNGEAPALTLEASGGGSAELELPMPVLTVSGTLESVGRLSKQVPRYYLTASGTTGAIGSAELTAPMPTLSAMSGSGGELEAPMPTLQATGVVGIVGNAVLKAPRITLVASGSADSVGVAELEVPSFFMPYASAELLAPMPTLQISEAVLTSTVNHVYAVNKTLGETTEYTNYAAEFTGTLNGLPLMIDANGINLITGETDNGSIIDSSATFAVSDFGASEQKRLLGVYFAGKGDGELYVVVRSANEQESVNDSDNRYHVGADTRRLKVGKGLSSRYLGISVESAAGAPFSIAGVEYLVGVMERRR